MLEKTLESPLDWKEIQPVHCKGDQPWVLFGRNDAKAETPVLWPPHAKSWFIGKDSDAERDWGQEEKGTTEDEMTGWHQRLNGRESGWTPGVGDGQGGLACCDSWGSRVRHDWATELNWTGVKDLISLWWWHWEIRETQPFFFFFFFNIYYHLISWISFEHILYMNFVKNSYIRLLRHWNNLKMSGIKQFQK